MVPKVGCESAYVIFRGDGRDGIGCGCDRGGGDSAGGGISGDGGYVRVKSDVGDDGWGTGADGNNGGGSDGGMVVTGLVVVM